MARHKSCPTCGSPREASGAESKFDFGAANAKGGLEREAVTEIAALGLAAAGVDWFCSYCGASNRGDDPACRTCGATRATPPPQSGRQPRRGAAGSGRS